MVHTQYEQAIHGNCRLKKETSLRVSANLSHTKHNKAMGYSSHELLLFLHL